MLITVINFLNPSGIKLKVNNEYIDLKEIIDGDVNEVS